MRSPKHLAGTVLVLVVIAVGIGLAMPDSTAGPVRPAPSGGARANPVPPVSRMTVVPGPAVGGPARVPVAGAPAPDAALAVARSWVQAFLTVPKGIDSARWVEQLRPYTTDELLPELRSVDPANVPAAKIIGAPRTVSTSVTSAEVDVPTTGVVMRLLLVATPSGWRVAGYQRVG
ncbi:MAG: hypothetical protein ACRDSR_17710 [Pseudonocardiaceae bacterium]